tara:strand:+ start:6162 stop:6821 length:660 start_codon:yes stop_codon:yes gene_type:complete
MKQLKQEKMKEFLRTNYLTLFELAKKCDIDDADIIKLQTAQCIPGNSYELRSIDIFSSPVAEDHIASTNVRYYHPSTVSWVKEALTSSKPNDLAKVAQQFKISFHTQLEKEFKGEKTLGCQNFDQAWGYWMDGTWGVCLKELTVECMARKELSRLRITNLMKYERTAITKKDKINLINAINDYVLASMAFPPYGIRHMLPEEAIKKFQLEIALDMKYSI